MPLAADKTDATPTAGDHAQHHNDLATAVNGLGTSKSDALVPTAVKSGSYTAAASDYVPVDASAGSVTITLPAAPADGTRIGVKLIATSGTNLCTVQRSGSDVFNKAGGSTSVTLQLANQSVVLQYKATGGIWYVVSTDAPVSGLDTRYLSMSGTLATRPSASGLPNGTIYVATDVLGGTPYQVQAGAWVAIGARGVELGYAEITANQTFTSTSYVKVTGLLLSNLVIPADRPVFVEVYCAVVFNSNVNGWVALNLCDDPLTTTYGVNKFVSATVNATGPSTLKRRFAAGTCPTSLQVYAAASAATGTVSASTGVSSNVAPAYIRAVAL